MKVTLGELFNAKEALGKLGERELPFKTSFKLVKLSKMVNQELEFFEEKRRLVIEAYAEKDEEGNIKPNEDGTVQIIPSKIETCNMKIQELLGVETELDIPEISLDEFEGMGITPRELFTIEQFFTE